MKRIFISLLGIPAAYVLMAFIEAQANPFEWVPFARVLMVLMAFYFIYEIHSKTYWSRK